MGAYCGNDEEYTSATKFYCRLCVIECFGRPKQIGKWDNKLCLACEETFLDKEICLHDDNKIWQMALAKIKGASPEEIKTIKDNPSEFIELDWNPEPVINLLNPEEFYEHYQEIALIRKE
ncbi:hypothetical protein G9A89_022072 [Geosiphon pyriformis]|nr:hypothetical protein G9A89_022072 [Geosiphon pyriformis]